MPNGDKIPFDYIGAKKAGYSDGEIMSFLKDKYSFDFDLVGAKKSGYSDKEIADYITAYEPPKKKEETVSIPSSKDYAGASTLFTLNGKKKIEQTGGQFVKAEKPQKPEIEIDPNDPFGSIDKHLENKIGEVRSKPLPTGTEMGAINTAFQKYKEEQQLNDTREQIKQQVIPDVETARLWTFQQGKQFNPQNKTDVLAQQVLDNYNKAKNVVHKNQGDIDRAAFDFYADKDPNLKLLKDKGQMPDPVTQANLTESFLKEKGVKQLKKDDVQYGGQLNQAESNFYQNHPEKRFNKILNQVAQGLEDYGENNWFLNLHGRNRYDKVVDKLVEDGKMDRFDADFFKKTEDQLPKGMSLGIPTPGVVETAARSAAKSIEDIPKSVYEATGLENVMTNKEDRAYRNLQEEANRVGFTPTGIHKISQAVGNLAGIALPIGQEGKALKAANMVGKLETGQEIAMGLTFYHDIQKENELKDPNNPLLNHLSSMIQSAIFMKLNPALGTLSKTLARDSAPEIKEVLSKLKTGEITGTQAKETIVDNILNRAKTAGKQSVSTATQMSLATGLSDAVSGVLTGKFDLDQTAQNMKNTFESMLIGSFPLGAIGARGSERELRRDVVKAVAENPEMYKEHIQKLASEDPEFAKIAPELLTNIDHINEVNKRLPDLKPKEKDDFLFTELNKKILEKKIADNPSKILASKDEKELAANEIEQKNIIDPMGSQKYVEEFYDNDLIPKADRIMLEDEKGKFSPNKAGAYLKFIAQQANGFNEDWSPTGRKPTMEQYPEQLIETANERWKKEIEEATPKEKKPLPEGSQDLLSKEEEKPRVRVTAEQVEERQPEKIRQRYIDDFNVVEDSKFDWRVTSELSSADRKKAVADIKAGKDTAAARKLNKEVDDMMERGTVIINRGRGTQAETVEIPIDEWFKFTPIEHDRAIKAAESAPDEVISIIKDNDITLQNIDNLKDLFNGFPYDETDFNKVKTYLQGEATRNAETARVGEQSQVQQQPTTEKTIDEAAIKTGVEVPEQIPPSEKTPAEEPTIEAGKGAEPPKEPPTEPTTAEAEEKPLRDKGILNKLYAAKGTPEAAKRGFEEKGLKYETASQEEAQKVASTVIDEFGIDKAIEYAEAQKFDGDVNSLIYAESLNRLADLESKSKTPQEKLDFAKQYAEIAIKYDEAGRKGGRFNSAINYFYKKSPLGIEIMENAKRKENFDQWAKRKDKSWKDFFDELMKEPDFEKIVKEKVSEELKKERTEARKTRIKKVEDSIDKMIDDIEKGGAVYSSIIPPKLVVEALRGAKAAYKAGEAISKIIEDAIQYVKEKSGIDSWDSDKFRKKVESILGKGEGISALERYKKTLETQISSLEKQITEKKREFKETKKTELDEEAQKLAEKRDELKKQLEEAVPLKDTEEYKKRLLEKFRKKLKGLSDKEKEEVVRKSFKKIVDSGGLEYEDFRKIISDVTGRGDLKPEDTAKIKELVSRTNELDAAVKNLQKERTNEAYIKYKAAQLEAGKAGRELGEILWNKPDILKRLTSIMQLNTLGLPSLVNNPLYNVFNQIFVRFPVVGINSVIDSGITLAAKAMGKKYMRQYSISPAIQVEFFKKLGIGASESFEQLMTGLNRQDYINKEVYGQQIRPWRAAKDLLAHFQGEKKLSSRQIWDKSLQATVGVPAEIVARVLNLGDKPQRFAAEGAQGATFAKNLGLKGIDYKLFIEFPREEAYRIYKEKGFSEEEAGKKADFIRDVIIKEGQRSTFQQDNLLNDLITRAFSVFGGKDSGIANLLKSITISPYIKIPSNAFWSYYNLVNPEVAMLQSLVHGGRALALRGKGGNESALALREARYWLGHAVAGIALRGVTAMLVQQGIFTAATEKEDTKKEREGRAFFEPQGTVDLTKLWALMRGEDPSQVKNSVTISNRWFGQLGTVGNAIARKWEDMTPEQRKAQIDVADIMLGGMEVDALKDLQSGVFANSSAIISSLGSGGYGGQQYLNNLMGMFLNTAHPATLAQISRAQLPYYSTNKADKFSEQLENTLLQRSSWLREATGKYPPSRLNIWGEPMVRPGSTTEKLFGINRVNKDNFAQPIYEDVKKTGDIGFFPPSVPPTIGKQKLTTEQSRVLESYVGQARKTLVAPYINDMAQITGFNKTYSQIENPEMRKKVLNYLYDLGKAEGLKRFAQDYPEFKQEVDSISKEIEEIPFEIFKAIEQTKTIKQ